MAWRDRDARTDIYILRAFIYLYPACQILTAVAVVCLWLGGALNTTNRFCWAVGLAVILSPISALLVALMVPSLAESGGTTLTKFLIGSRSWRSLREQLSGDVEIIRHLTRQGDYSRALEKVEAVLARDPDSPEALCLKARILWQGFRNQKEAWLQLRRILEITPKDDPHNRWAREYYLEVTSNSSSDS
ncbi:MAG: hypothetical protein HQK55_12645 [Deltaproteobacteria bacterium]|nr:hypothetical protein [Deltaproteobacteria bacterium]